VRKRNPVLVWRGWLVVAFPSSALVGVAFDGSESRGVLESQHHRRLGRVEEECIIPNGRDLFRPPLAKMGQRITCSSSESYSHNRSCFRGAYSFGSRPGDKFVQFYIYNEWPVAVRILGSDPRVPLCLIDGRGCRYVPVTTRQFYY
jgi:hypothetical protein